jgi:c-di-GMP-binding flagellar brake protein YcgR
MSNAIQPPLITEELPLRIEPEEYIGAVEYAEHSPAEISRLMDRLVEQGAPVSIYTDDSERFTPARARSFAAHQLSLSLPEAPIEAPNGVTVLLVSLLDRVKLQFTAELLETTEIAGEAIARVSLPKEVLRLQRREYYRLTADTAHPLTCHLPTGYGDEVEVSLIDISVGGVGILGYAPGVPLEPSRVFHGTRIVLADTGTVVADLEIRTSFDVTLRNGIRSVRTGARFLHLPSAMQTLIQRYITRIERSRLQP